MTIQIAKHWDGTELPFSQYTTVKTSLGKDSLRVEFESPIEEYTTPDSPVGFTDGLWEYDVVELFIAQPNGEYVEIEAGPKGHWLVYEFESYRKQKDLPKKELEYTCAVEDGVWKGVFTVPLSWLSAPIGECTVNAYQYRSAGDQFLAWQSIPSIEPDFHKTECFQLIA